MIELMDPIALSDFHELGKHGATPLTVKNY